MKIDREKARAGALALLDEVGLDKLTMRALGTSLNMQAASLYYHFPSKQALLDDMADAIIAPVVRQVGGMAPEAIQAGDLARAFRTALLAYRDGALVVTGSYGATPNVLKFADILLGCFLRTGLEKRRAVEATFNLTYFVQGFVLEEQAFLQRWGAPAHARDRALAADEFRKQLSDETPHLRACMEEVLQADFQSRFDAGLAVFLGAPGVAQDEQPDGER